MKELNRKRKKMGEGKREREKGSWDMENSRKVGAGLIEIDRGKVVGERKTDMT